MFLAMCYLSRCMPAEPPFHIRAATKNDAQLLFEWRNEASARMQSRNTVETTWEDHLAWVTKVITGRIPAQHLYVVENKENMPVGTVRSDATEEGYTEISYTVAPEWRGKGVGREMTLQFAKEFLPGKKLKAVIKKGHAPSESIARALGLSPAGEEPGGNPGDEPFIIWK